MDSLFGGPVAANDNTPKKRVRDRSRENELRLAKAPERQCELCGKTFKKVSKDKAPLRFCSKACSSFLNSKKAKNGWIPKTAVFSVFRPLCSHCGARFTAKTVQGKYCSRECILAVGRQKALRYSAANDNVDRSERPCAECGFLFSPEYGEKRSVYCSVDCGGKNARRRRRKKEKARLRGVLVETVDPVKVFERDKWKCQICGVRTPRKLRGTYGDRAPELDHIMPLSLGGAHSYMNTQCACRKCNAAKSNTPPKQPSLFAYAA